MNAPPVTQGQVYADIRTRIDLMLGEEPDEVTITFSVPRDGLSLDEVKLIDQSIYESVPRMKGVAFSSVSSSTTCRTTYSPVIADASSLTRRAFAFMALRITS